MNYYAQEKLLEFERERAKNQLPLPPEKPRRRAVFGAIIARTGRTLRRAGEGLESWAEPAQECDPRYARQTPPQ